MATSKQKEGATTLREKKGSSSSSAVSSARRSPSSRSSLPTSPLRRPERPTVAPSRGPTAVTASTAVAKPPPTRRPTERNLPAATALKERAVLHRAPSSSSKAAAAASHKPSSASAPASEGRASHSTPSAAVRGRSPGAVAKRKEASKTVSLSRTSSDPGSLDQFAASILLGDSKIEESTETAASISSIEDHLPDERLPDPVDSKAVEDPPPPPPPPHECDKQQDQHEQSLLRESEGVAQPEEMIKEDNIEIAHNNTTLEDPRGGGGDVVEGEKYKKEKLVGLLEVKKSTEGVMKSNDVIEETRSKLLERKKSKVRALVGAFETVMSLHGSSEGQTDDDQTQEEKGGGEMD